jgi:YHS domain-containing protein
MKEEDSLRHVSRGEGGTRMKRVLLCAGAALVLASAGLAVEKDKKAAAKTEAYCPIMTKNKVKIKDATKKKMFADYKGRRYFFCCAGCPDAFKKDPAKYAKADSIPTPKAK